MGILPCCVWQETGKPVEDIKPEDIDDGPKKGSTKLRAEAPAFVFNPGAKPFKPSGGPPAAAEPVATAAPPVSMPQDPQYVRSTIIP